MARKRAKVDSHQTLKERFPVSGLTSVRLTCSHNRWGCWSLAGFSLQKDWRVLRPCEPKLAPACDPHPLTPPIRHLFPATCRWSITQFPASLLNGARRSILDWEAKRQISARLRPLLIEPALFFNAPWLDQHCLSSVQVWRICLGLWAGIGFQFQLHNLLSWNDSKSTKIPISLLINNRFQDLIPYIHI